MISNREEMQKWPKAEAERECIDHDDEVPEQRSLDRNPGRPGAELSGRASTVGFSQLGPVDIQPMEPRCLEDS